MSPDQEATLFQTIGRIDERTRQTNEAVIHLRNDIADIYGENKEDRKTCESHREKINNRIDEVEEKALEITEKKEVKAEEKKQKAFDNKYVRIATIISILSVGIGVAGFFI